MIGIYRRGWVQYEEVGWRRDTCVCWSQDARTKSQAVLTGEQIRCRTDSHDVQVG